MLEGFWSQAPHVPRHVRDTLCKGASSRSLGAVSSARPRPVLQVREGASASFPSLLSHLTSMYLNTPVLALPVARRQAPGPALRSFHPLASSLPCDFHLLNLRTLQAEVSVRFSAGSSEWTLPLSIQPYLPGRGAALPVSPAETPPRPHTRTHAPTPIHTCAHTCTAPCVCYQEDGLPSAETALLLHRKGFDCGLQAKNLGFNCTTSQGKVSRAPVWEGSRGQGNITRHSGHRAH